MTEMIRSQQAIRHRGSCNQSGLEHPLMTFVHWTPTDRSLADLLICRKSTQSLAASLRPMIGHRREMSTPNTAEPTLIRLWLSATVHAKSETRGRD